MPSPRNTRKLLKNPNHLLEATEHLRPRGSYDPLPPPGGYPLPACIRRKFSFAPQLPNLSMLSLMPDFASSSSDLGIQLDESTLQHTLRETPNSLHVHCSSPRRPETAGVEQHQAPLKPSSSGIQIAYFNSSASRRPVLTGVTNDTRNNTPFQGLPPDVRPSQRLRRVQGQKSLHLPTASNLSDDTASESSSKDMYENSSAPTTPRTSASSFENEPVSVASLQADDDPLNASHPAQAEKEVYQLVRRLAKQSPNLLGSFCIIDLQLDGNPIQCTSHDMLPTDLASDEALFLDESSTGTPYKLQTVPYGDEEMQTVPIAGALVDLHSSSARPTHRFVGLVHLSDLLEDDTDVNEDVWLEIAHEEMAKAGIRRSHRKRQIPKTAAAS